MRALDGRVEIVVDGQPCAVPEGVTVAAALLQDGWRALRRTRWRREPRSLFCGMGICQECVVMVDGRPGVRSCLTLVRPGMQIETRGSEGTDQP